MYVRKRINNYFLSFLDDSEILAIHLESIDVSQFNGLKLDELKKSLKKAELKYDKMALFLSIVEVINNGAILSNVLEKIRNADNTLMKCRNKLDHFESNLALLIIFGTIKIEDCEQLGFDREYIEKLLRYYKSLMKNPYVTYYYNEQTGSTSRISEDGKMIVLSHTPAVVMNEIREKANFSVGKRRFRSELW